MERMVTSQQLEWLMLLRDQITCEQRTALWTGNMGDTDILKEHDFSERKLVFAECWGRNLIKIKVQMRGEEAEAVSIAFQTFSYSGEQISGVKGKFFDTGDLREYLYANGNCQARGRNWWCRGEWMQRKEQNCGERGRWSLIGGKTEMGKHA